LGSLESYYENNWVQVCIKIYQDTTGEKNFYVNTALCNPYTDCAGQLYGSAQPDCNGICNGPALRGDMDGNGMRNIFDANAYMNGLLNSNLPATPCNDLYADGKITVYEDALLNDCMLYGDNYPLPSGGYHNYCDFPAGLYNFTDTVTFSIGEVNTDDEYVDILVYNPDNGLNAYEFTMQGLTIDHVVTLASAADYPATPQYITGGVKVACYSAVDSSLDKTSVYQPLCRIYYATIGDTVCIDEVIDAISHTNQKVAGVKSDSACKVLFDFISGIDATDLNIQTHPNPTTGLLNVRFNLPVAADFTIDVVNALGQVVVTEAHSATIVYDGQLDLRRLPVGAYTLKVHGPSVNASHKVVVVR
jgi:hypothetical protein